MKKILCSTFMALFITGANGQHITETKTQTRTGSTTTETYSRSETGYENGQFVYTHTHSHVTSAVVHGGIKVDANASGFFAKNADSRMGYGASLGGFMKVEFSGNIALQYELMFHYKSSTVEDKASGRASDYEYWGVEIPLYVMGQVRMGAGKGFIGIGPYGGFGLEAKYKPANIHLYKKDETTGRPMNRWDVGAGGIIGYELRSGLTVTGGYQAGFFNMLNADTNQSLRNKTVYLGFGFKF